MAASLTEYLEQVRPPFGAPFSSELNEGPSGCVILYLLRTAAVEEGSRWLHKDLPTRQLR